MFLTSNIYQVFNNSYSAVGLRYFTHVCDKLYLINYLHLRIYFNRYLVHCRQAKCSQSNFQLWTAKHLYSSKSTGVLVDRHMAMILFVHERLMYRPHCKSKRFLVPKWAVLGRLLATKHECIERINRHESTCLRRAINETAVYQCFRNEMVNSTNKNTYHRVYVHKSKTSARLTWKAINRYEPKIFLRVRWQQSTHIHDKDLIEHVWITSFWTYTHIYVQVFLNTNWLFRYTWAPAKK